MKVILLSIDTLRSDHLGCYGYHCTQTPTSPFIDSLAEQGVVFERHYATDVPTPPSYTSLFFGTRAIKNGIYTFGQHPKEFTCPTPSLAELFYRHGHRTGMISNLSLVYPWLHRGFLDIHKPGNRFQGGTAEEVTEEAFRWLKEFGKKDFFLFIHYWDPHVPYLKRSKEEYRKLFSPKEYRGRAPDMKYFNNNPKLKEAYREKHARIQDPYEPEENLALYDANIRLVDDNIRMLFDGFSKLGIDRSELLFLLTSDHGEAFGEYGFWDHFSGYRNISQVPLIVCGPGVERRRTAAYTQHVDILPTVCALAGIETDSRLSGKSMIGLLPRGDDAFREEILVETAFGAIQRMFIRDEFALVHTLWRGDRDHIKEYELFDLRKDPDQVQDISERNPDLTHNLRIALDDRVNRETGGSAFDKLRHMAYQKAHPQVGFFLRK